MTQIKRYKYFLFLLVFLNTATWSLPAVMETGEIARASDGNTAIEIQVITKNGVPVPRAQVSLSNPVISGTTDDRGFVRLDDLAAPDKSKIDVTVTASGYKGWTLQGTYLLSADTLKVKVELVELAPGEPPSTEVKQAPVPRWMLTGNNQTSPEPGPVEPKASNSRNYSDTTPPATIRVKRVNLNRIDIVPFNDYVKHVLPNEWIPSWLPESLKAGAMAVKTYAWYWTNFTKYPDQGFDVRDDTADQVYNPDVSYASTDNAVDAVAAWRMTRASAIFRSHYCAGVVGDGSKTDTKCGNTTGNWLSQWGSQYWAQQGKDFNWILTYYYDKTELSNNPNQVEVIVDNGGPGFTANYTQHPWNSQSACTSINGTSLYTGNSQIQLPDHNEAYWQPALPQAGYYDVWVNVPGCNASTKSARYQVHYAGGNVVTVPLDQYVVTGFVKLGNWLFNPDSTSFIYLDDVTGETLGSTKVAADAIKWVYTGPPPPALTGITVTPASATINQGATRQFTATGTFSNGTSADITSSVTWSSSNTGVATVSPGGLASGVGYGTATITAAKDGKTGSGGLKVQIAIGQGGAYPQQFIDVYNRRGGQANFGPATDTVKQFGTSGVYWQPIGGTGNPSGLGGIFYHQAGGSDPAKIRAFIISGGNYTFYRNAGGPSNSFGPPTSDEFQNVDKQWQVNFSNGYILDKGAATQFTPWPTSFTGWKASYFNNAALYSGPSLVQDEGTPTSLDFSYNWGSNLAPLPEKGLYFDNNWSARWERNYTFTEGYYKFKLCGDDGIRLFLNGGPVINQWKDQGYTCYDYTTGFSASTTVPIKIEYYQGTGGAQIDFKVESLSPMVVTKAIDDGSEGTLSNLLSNSVSGMVISFAKDLTTITFAKNVTSLPSLKPGVKLLGYCSQTGPQVVIDGSGLVGDGLILDGNNQVSGIWLKNFPGRKIVTTGKGNQFIRSCVKATID
jgi:hypothetical protein